IAEELNVEEVLPEWLGANLLIQGFPELTQLTMGSRILFPSGAGLICMGETSLVRYLGVKSRSSIKIMRSYLLVLSVAGINGGGLFALW
ncbi:hypothetical protein RYX45_22510, partial [Alkalihalophilus pseudofirmus]|nr:hypothetical protein [Alkalihalophilus pseudofirmus]